MLMLLLLWPTQPPVHVVCNDPYALHPSTGRASMGYEVESLFERNGLDVRVHFARKGKSLDTMPGPRVNVMLSPFDATAFGLDERAMAAAVGKRSEGFTIFVFLPAVRRTLAHPPDERGVPPRRMQELSRGVGRIIAHELIHVLAPERGHARSGLMSRTLSRRALLDGTIELDAASRRMVLDRLGKLRENFPAIPLS